MFASATPRPSAASVPGPPTQGRIYAWFISTEEERLVFLRPQLRLPRRICFSAEQPTGSIPESLICTASCAFYMAGRLFLLSGSTKPITRPAPDQEPQGDEAHTPERKLNIVDALRLGRWTGSLQHGAFVVVRLDPMFRVCAETEWTFIDNSWAANKKFRPGTEPARLATVDTRNRSAFDDEVEFKHDIQLECQPFNRGETSFLDMELHRGTTQQAIELGRGPRRVDTGAVILSNYNRAIGMATSVQPDQSRVEVLMLNDTFWAYLAEITGVDDGKMDRHIIKQMMSRTVEGSNNHLTFRSPIFSSHYQS